jgi:aerobic-type carbon monoxide dehydrogenase small subunit (CoxS/CutS family)
VAAAGRDITTIEGRDDHTVEAVRAAWQALAVRQYGYRQSGQILAATDLLSIHADISDEQIAEHTAGTLCRCRTISASARLCDWQPTHWQIRTTNMKTRAVNVSRRRSSNR